MGSKILASVCPQRPNNGQPPSGDLWVHEIKHDGFRVIARKEGKLVKLYSWPALPADCRGGCLRCRWCGELRYTEFSQRQRPKCDSV
jgi:hypothetical protein